jgi:hypothetical protein
MIFLCFRDLRSTDRICRSGEIRQARKTRRTNSKIAAQALSSNRRNRTQAKVAVAMYGGLQEKCTNLERALDVHLADSGAKLG